MGEQAEKPPEEKKPEESKDAPPAPEILLRVFMHCEGCARKVRRCLRGFDGVEDVQTDCKTHKVVVKGEKADPMKVLERIQKKSHRQVELLSPVPKPPADEPKVEAEKEAPKPEEKKEEPPQVINVILKVNMHCEACAQVIRKRILRMKGVESAETDLKNSQVSVKGTFEPPEMVDYIHKRTGKQAVVVKQDPEPKKEEENSKEDKKDAGETKEDKKPDGAGAGAGAGEGKEKKKEKEKEKEEDKVTDEKKNAGDGGGEKAADGGPAGGGGEDTTVLEVRKNEFYDYRVPLNYQFYPSRHTAEWAYGYPPAPQMFSDENPNACSVM